MHLSVKQKKIGNSLLIALSGLVFSFSIHAEIVSISQTKIKLKQLESQITKLKQTLANAHDKWAVLNQEAAHTEKQMGDGIHALQVIQQDMKTKEQKIVKLEQRSNHLNQRLVVQQTLLADHVRARYLMGEYQPLKWLLNQDDPAKISRLLTLYQYLIHSRQQLIGKIDSTKRHIFSTQQALKNELKSQQQLQQNLYAHQQQLEQHRRYHDAIMQSLNHEIQNKEQTLRTYQQNKDNLTKLLKTLALETIVQAKKPFTAMRKKLPHPLQSAAVDVQKMNHGLTFFAGEGTPVSAVYSGKVVFSDWLNGYGLLLIIDHGEGFMTLYAHNQSLFKQKGALVLQGEQIATVGHSGGLKQNGLYFEVRQRGKAVSPSDWLT